MKLQSMPDGPEKQKLTAVLQQRQHSAARVFVGKTEEKDAKITLADDRGRPRIALIVTASGTARIDFLDDNGKVTSSYPR